MGNGRGMAGWGDRQAVMKWPVNAASPGVVVLAANPVRRRKERHAVPRWPVTTRVCASGRYGRLSFSRKTTASTCCRGIAENASGVVMVLTKRNGMNEVDVRTVSTTGGGGEW